MNRLFILLSLFFLSQECLSQKVISFYVKDKSEIKASTFSFYLREKESLLNGQTTIDSLVEQSISSTLINKGYKKDFPCDLYVSFQLNSAKTIKQTHIHSPNQTEILGSPFVETKTHFDESSLDIFKERKEGILLIEIWDINDKLIWQGSKSFKVRSSTDVKQMLIQYASEITSAFKAGS